MKNAGTAIAGVLAAVAALMGGCGAGQGSGTAERQSAEAAALVGSASARQVSIVRSSGQAATWEELVQACETADVVAIGENHGHAIGLAAAAALWEDVLERKPRAVLAMEFFERDQQDALDDYLSGVIDESAFRSAARKTSSEGYPPGHRAMIERAKKAGRPVIAANAPRRYVRLARTDGYARLLQLTGEQQRLFRVPEDAAQASSGYREAFEKVMNENGGVTEAQKNNPAFMEQRKKDLDATFRSQWMWDNTMAESVVRGLDVGTPVVLVVGRFHVDHAGGTVQMIRSLRPSTRVVVVSFDTGTLDAAKAMTDAPERAGRADFVVYAGKVGG